MPNALCEISGEECPFTMWEHARVVPIAKANCPIGKYEGETVRIGSFEATTYLCRHWGLSDRYKDDGSPSGYMRMCGITYKDISEYEVDELHEVMQQAFKRADTEISVSGHKSATYNDDGTLKRVKLYVNSAEKNWKWYELILIDMNGFVRLFPMDDDEADKAVNLGFQAWCNRLKMRKESYE